MRGRQARAGKPESNDSFKNKTNDTIIIIIIIILIIIIIIIIIITTDMFFG